MLMQIHASTKSKNEESFILPRLIRRGCTQPYLSAKGFEVARRLQIGDLSEQS